MGGPWGTEAPGLDADITAELSHSGLEIGVVFPLVYQQLRDLAHRYFRGRDQTIQPTGLVHEAYLKLADAPGALQIRSRAHFCALAARAMRQILVDRSRRRAADKRGGDQERITLAGLASDPERPVDIVDLDRAIAELAEVDPRRARIVELRYFGGMTVEEIAAHLEVSSSTIEKSWRGARAWLASRLSG